MTAKSGVLIPAQPADTAGDSLPPNPRRRLRLTTARDVRRELCAVYVDARLHGVNSQHCARLVFMLDRIRAAIEADTLEARIAALEQHAQQNR